jgi:hypothetical protein
MDWSSFIIGGVKGSLAGGAAGASFTGGNPYGAIVGAIIGGVAGHVEAYYEGDEKEKIVANQKKTATESSHINETLARRQARAAHEAAMNSQVASSDQLFTKAALQREADTNYASVRDKGNPFTADNEKRSQRPAPAPQFYGNVERTA